MSEEIKNGNGAPERRTGESTADLSPDRTESRSTGDAAVSRRFAVEAARTLADNKCEDVVLLDVRGLSQVTDYILIGSGTSDRQMRSTAGDVSEIGAEMGFSSLGVSDDARAVWIVADFVDVVVHLFEPNTRAHYDLEMLWGDADRVAWQRDGGGSDDRNLAGLKPDERESLRDGSE